MENSDKFKQIVLKLLSSFNIEQDHEWRIADDEAEYWLEVKYMAREYIIEAANTGGGGLRQSVYQRFLDESATSS